MQYSSLLTLNYILLSVSCCQTASVQKLCLFLMSVPGSLILITWKDGVGRYFSSGFIRYVQRNCQASTCQCPYLVQQQTPFSTVGSKRQIISWWFLSLVLENFFCFSKHRSGSEVGGWVLPQSPFADFDWSSYQCYATCKNFERPAPNTMSPYCMQKWESNIDHIGMVQQKEQLLISMSK